MLRWCAYCQRYLGETPPYNSFDLTHGMCDQCLHRGLALTPEASQKMKVLSKYQAMLWEAGVRGDLRSARSLVDEGIALNLRALDILLGFVTPALYRVGSLWECSEITVVEEHRFTRYYEQILEILFDSIYMPLTEEAPKPKTILTCSVKNIHTLGVRIIELSLLAQGRSVFSICPGVPNQELVDFIVKLKPEVVGVSIATMDHMRDLEELSELLEDLEDRPLVFAGGTVVKNQKEMPEIPHIRYEWQLDKFINHCP